MFSSSSRQMLNITGSTRAELILNGSFACHITIYDKPARNFRIQKIYRLQPGLNSQAMGLRDGHSTSHVKNQAIVF
ncbi:hypothetical protein TNCV_1617911 [Trichonephila clavipes]|nr:hypothetical protein TNCV_1617911 [Trichonephila clavipes]